MYARGANMQRDSQLNLGDFFTQTGYGLSELSIITAEIHQGQNKQGVSKGPSTLLEGHLIRNLSPKFFDIKCFQGSESPLSFLKTHNNPYQRLYKKTKKIVDTQKQTLILGGDHSMSLGIIPALKYHYPNLKVLWVDAHGDINTPKTSPTGNLHGMPVAALLGLFPLYKNAGWEWFSPCLDPSDIVYIGVRDLDWGEEKIMKHYGIRCYTTDDVKQRGMAEVIEEACEYLNPDGNSPVHVSFDIDSLDPRYAPATGVPVKDGLTLNQVIDMASYIKSTQQMVSLEMVEFNPDEVKYPFEVNLTKACMERVIQNFL